jgi:adenylate cyclase
MYGIIGLLILASSLITLYFYVTKKREHKRLKIAYRDLDNTKSKLVGAEQRIVKLLRQHVSGDVAKELLMDFGDKPVERRFVCIMFLDIRDFTPMAEKLSPEEIITYQNKVFGFMIDIIHQHHGNINQLLGDGFMATFGAPVSRGNDCQNAFVAANEILKEVKERSEAGDILKTKVGIGLHAGYVVTGNVGNESRKQYSVTGNPVIIASRVEQLNKEYKSQLIITEEVYDKLDKPLKLTQPFLEVEVKGRTHPVRILKIA